MRLINRATIILFLFFSLLQFSPLVCKGQIVTRTVSPQQYDEVLEKLFPRTISDERNSDWQIVLRFVPHRAHESQIMIQKTINGCHLVKLTPAEGYIFNTINKWYALNENNDISQMASLVKMSRIDLNIRKSSANQMRDDLFNSLSKSSSGLSLLSRSYDRTGGWSFPLHGARYEIWFSSRDVEFSYRLLDQDTETKISGRSPLVRWMNKIRISYERQQP